MFTVNGEPRKPNNEEDGCIYCQKEKDAIKTLTSDVERWAKETKVNTSLKKLLDGKKISLGEIAFHNFDSAQNNCRLVHRDDIGIFLVITVKGSLIVPFISRFGLAPKAIRQELGVI